MRDVVVIGAGLHRYGIFPDKTTIDMGTEAISLALKDAGMVWKDIEAAYCGTVQPGVSGGMPSATRWDTRASASLSWKTPQPADRPHSGRRTCPWPPARTTRCSPSV